MNGDPRYKAILDRMWALHCEKANDYGTAEDPLENLRQSESIGIETWRTCIGEAMNAFFRVKNHCNRGHLDREKLKNAMMDTAAFMMLGMLFIEEGDDRAARPLALSGMDVEEYTDDSWTSFRRSWTSP